MLCPHPRAVKSTIWAAKIVRDAAVAAGAPPDIISWVDAPSNIVSQALMQAPEVSLILATGGPGMVKAAYSSGHPAAGVGERAGHCEINSSNSALECSVRWPCFLVDCSLGHACPRLSLAPLAQAPATRPP